MQSVQIEAANQNIAKQIAETLHEHYPGHMWACEGNVEQGIATVMNLDLSQEYGYVIHLDTLLHDPTPKPIIKVGGEFLERYNVKRGAFNEDDYALARKNIKGEFMDYDS